MLNRRLQLLLLFAAVLMPLAGCIFVPYRHHDHDGGYDRRGPGPGYYRGY